MLRILSRFWGLRPFERHSLVLLVAGFIYIGVGVALCTAKLTPERERSLVVALRWMPLRGWGACFIIAGLMAILSSRWPKFAVTWGYAVLTGLSAGWAATYFLSFFVADDVSVTNASSGLIWALMAFMWWAISGLLNPTTVIMKHEKVE